MFKWCLELFPHLKVHCVLDDLLTHAISATNRIDLWHRVFQGHGVSRMAEVGVWQGDYAAAMLSECPGISTYYLIDPWRPLDRWNKPLNVSAERFTDAHHKAMEAVAFAGARVVVLRGTTKEVVDAIPDGSLDAIYVDGDHTLRGIAIDLIRMLPKLRLDGLLGGDDFFPDPWHHGLKYEPTLVSPFAVHFAEAMDLPVVALPFNQFLIRNRPGAFSFTNVSGLKHSGCVGRPANILYRGTSALARRFRGLFTTLR